MADGQACAVLQPALAEAARRAGVRDVGLVDVGRGHRPWATLNLRPDQVLTTYGDGTVLGGQAGGGGADGPGAVRLTCRLVGGRSLPDGPLPRVVARAGPLADPLADSLSDPEAGPSAGLLGALAQVPDDALPVVTTTWALSALSRSRREGFVELLARCGRRCAWLSVEGVGVAPGVPTLGDRPASGHSLVGLALVDGDGGPVRAEVLARCWSRGAVLAWLAEAPPTGG